MSDILNFRDKKLPELKEICRSDPQKYRGFSTLKKEDLIDFMYQKNSTRQRRRITRPSYDISDVSYIFETPDEREERILEVNAEHNSLMMELTRERESRMRAEESASQIRLRNDEKRQELAELKVKRDQLREMKSQRDHAIRRSRREEELEAMGDLTESAASVGVTSRIHNPCERSPEDTMIQELIGNLKTKYSNSNVIFDSHNDINDNLIYRANKEKYISKHGSLGEHGEDILYHGTDEQNLISIINEDFRLTNNPVHGHMYGKGIYFTNDIEKALYYSERGKTTKYVIVCMVHIGDICLGNATMDIHPKIPNSDKYFDTSVDNIHSPKQFIKKKNGTYNILGIITIENYTENSYISQNIQTNKFSSSFKIFNKTNKKLALYWIPPGVTYNVYTVDISKCVYMNIIPPRIAGSAGDGVLDMKSQKYHRFACVIYKTNKQYSTRDIVKIFMLVNPSVIINIDPWDL